MPWVKGLTPEYSCLRFYGVHFDAQLIACYLSIDCENLPLLEEKQLLNMLYFPSWFSINENMVISTKYVKTAEYARVSIKIR